MRRAPDSPLSTRSSTPTHARTEAWETGFTGIRTFAGCPYVNSADDVDVAIVGVPFDGATSFRPGARFGPEAIRAASGTLRGYHPALGVEVFESLSIVDWGDLVTVPGDTARTVDAVDRSLRALLAHEVAPVVIGGDHSIIAGVLAAHAAVSGPIAVVLLDAHADTLHEEDQGQPLSHGTWLRRAVETGSVIPGRSVIAGTRGAVLDAAELQWPLDAGFDLITCDELRSMTPEAYGHRVQERVGDTPAHLTVDVDVVDPAFAPGTGTPEVGGLASHELLSRLRSLTEIDFRGFDIVEVSPPYDNAGKTTALLASNIVYDFLALLALAWRGINLRSGPPPVRTAEQRATAALLG